jgi:hypothetical protein
MYIPLSMHRHRHGLMLSDPSTQAAQCEAQRLCAVGCQEHGRGYRRFAHEDLQYNFNFKVWGVPSSQVSSSSLNCSQHLMSRCNTNGSRASCRSINITVVRNAITKEPAPNWGPNATFRFPTHGGTGVSGLLSPRCYLPRRWEWVKRL